MIFIHGSRVVGLVEAFCSISDLNGNTENKFTAFLHYIVIITSMEGSTLGFKPGGWTLIKSI